MTRAPSQHLLARRLKLSGATVSRALANHPALSAETRARVQALAAELGYRGTAGRSVRRTADAPALKIGVLLGEPLVAADHLAACGIRARADLASPNQSGPGQDLRDDRQPTSGFVGSTGWHPSPD